MKILYLEPNISWSIFPDFKYVALPVRDMETTQYI